MTGYAITKDGDKICYACSDVMTRQQMKEHGVVAAYADSSLSNVTTWSGGHLATILTRGKPHPITGRRHVTALGEDGSRWYGWATKGMVMTLRRATTARHQR